MQVPAVSALLPLVFKDNPYTSVPSSMLLFGQEWAIPLIGRKLFKGSISKSKNTKKNLTQSYVNFVNDTKYLGLKFCFHFFQDNDYFWAMLRRECMWTGLI